MRDEVFDESWLAADVLRETEIVRNVWRNTSGVPLPDLIDPQPETAAHHPVSREGWLLDENPSVSSACEGGGSWVSVSK
jgi:hypothetical protein